MRLQLVALLLEEHAAREHDVAALLVELDDLELVGLADQLVEVADRAQVDLRAGEERLHAAADGDREAALHALADGAFDELVALARGADLVPDLHLVGLLLGEGDQAVVVLAALDETSTLSPALTVTSPLASANSLAGMTPSLLPPMSTMTESRLTLTTVPWTISPSLQRVGVLHRGLEEGWQTTPPGAGGRRGVVCARHTCGKSFPRSPAASIAMRVRARQAFDASPHAGKNARVRPENAGLGRGFFGRGRLTAGIGAVNRTCAALRPDVRRARAVMRRRARDLEQAIDHLIDVHPARVHDDTVRRGLERGDRPALVLGIARLDLAQRGGEVGGDAARAQVIDAPGGAASRARRSGTPWPRRSGTPPCRCRGPRARRRRAAPSRRWMPSSASRTSGCLDTSLAPIEICWVRRSRLRGRARRRAGAACRRRRCGSEVERARQRAERGAVGPGDAALARAQRHAAIQRAGVDQHVAEPHARARARPCSCPRRRGRRSRPRCAWPLTPPAPRRARCAPSRCSAGSSSGCASSRQLALSTSVSPSAASPNITAVRARRRSSRASTRAPVQRDRGLNREPGPAARRSLRRSCATSSASCGQSGSPRRCERARRRRARGRAPSARRAGTAPAGCRRSAARSRRPSRRRARAPLWTCSSAIGSCPARSPLAITEQRPPSRRSASKKPLRVGFQPTSRSATRLPSIALAAAATNAASWCRPAAPARERRQPPSHSRGSKPAIEPSRRTGTLERGQHALDVIGREQRLGDRGRAGGEQPGEQQRALGVGIGLGQRALEAAQRLVGQQRRDRDRRPQRLAFARRARRRARRARAARRQVIELAAARRGIAAAGACRSAGRAARRTAARAWRTSAPQSTAPLGMRRPCEAPPGRSRSRRAELDRRRRARAARRGRSRATRRPGQRRVDPRFAFGERAEHSAQRATQTIGPAARPRRAAVTAARSRCSRAAAHGARALRRSTRPSLRLARRRCALCDPHAGAALLEVAARAVLERSRISIVGERERAHSRTLGVDARAVERRRHAGQPQHQIGAAEHERSPGGRVRRRARRRRAPAPRSCSSLPSTSASAAELSSGPRRGGGRRSPKAAGRAAARCARPRG